MNKIVFDKAKLKRVPIDSTKPNTWNPKDPDTAEYARVRRSIELKGLRKPVIIRKGGEIIDGEQRWRACLELGFKEILVYDEGDVSDQEARELTIMYQQQVPFNDTELPLLIRELTADGDFELPYSPNEIDDILSMLESGDVSEDDYDVDAAMEDDTEPMDGKNSVTCPNCGHEFIADSWPDLVKEELQLTPYK